jgi:hypothetical protein
VKKNHAAATTFILGRPTEAKRSIEYKIIEINIAEITTTINFKINYILDVI